MLDSALLMRRAIRYVCDTHGITPEQLKSNNQFPIDKFQEYVFEVQEDMRFNQLKYFRPFEHQRKFFKTVY